MTYLRLAARAAQPLVAQKSARAFSVLGARSANDKSSLDANKGSIGSAFQPDGSVGGKANQVGGPFHEEGSVGRQFKDDGSIGGTAQQTAEQMQGQKPPVFDKEGAVGKQFQADGAIGSIGEKVGGPFSKDGTVGKHFNADGAIGGAVQGTLGEKK